MANHDTATVIGIRPAHDDTTPAWEPRAVTRARGLSELLSRRPELSGVYSPADVTAESVRWSA